MLPLGILASSYQATIPAGPAVFDNFNRADTTTGLGTSSSGHVWQPTTYGNARILGNKAQGISGAGGDPCVTVDAGVSDFIVKATVQQAGTNDFNLVGRYVNDANYWMAYHDSGSNGRYSLWNKNGGGYNKVFEATFQPAAGDVVELGFSGTSITLKVNGATLTTYTSNLHQAATKAGFRCGNGVKGAWDDFSISTA